ncbi:serine-rich adhesin for platelets-like [Physella acuta]|uniref:serine-rich adhesin for platelets-like n=1 Tax=Physella acuta TaxID=109671 RepID=UPI0027DAEC94|nr:serine-rich adhesin for platelets-like [Physella acuta]XP_059149388.1 serine-rich adhesin for platelets-like [Physella acuta]
MTREERGHFPQTGELSREPATMRRCRSLSELPGHHRVPILRRTDTARTRARLEAGEEGVKELRALRQHQQQLMAETMAPRDQTRLFSGHHRVKKPKLPTDKGQQILKQNLSSSSAFHSANSLASISEEQAWCVRSNKTPPFGVQAKPAQHSQAWNNADLHSPHPGPANLQPDDSKISNQTFASNLAYSGADVNFVKTQHPSKGMGRKCYSSPQNRLVHKTDPRQKSRTDSLHNIPEQLEQRRHVVISQTDQRFARGRTQSVHESFYYFPYSIPESSPSNQHDNIRQYFNPGSDSHLKTSLRSRSMQINEYSNRCSEGQGYNVSYQSTKQHKSMSWDNLIQSIGLHHKSAAQTDIGRNIFSGQNNAEGSLVNMSDVSLEHNKENDSQITVQESERISKKAGRSQSFTCGTVISSGFLTNSLNKNNKFKVTNDYAADVLEDPFSSAILRRPSILGETVITKLNPGNRIINPLHEVDITALNNPGPLHAVTLQYSSLSLKNLQALSTSGTLGPEVATGLDSSDQNPRKHGLSSSFQSLTSVANSSERLDLNKAHDLTVDKTRTSRPVTAETNNQSRVQSTENISGILPDKSSRNKRHDTSHTIIVDNKCQRSAINRCNTTMKISRVHAQHNETLASRATYVRQDVILEENRSSSQFSESFSKESLVVLESKTHATNEKIKDGQVTVQERNNMESTSVQHNVEVSFDEKRDVDNKIKHSEAQQPHKLLNDPSLEPVYLNMNLKPKDELNIKDRKNLSSDHIPPEEKLPAPPSDISQQLASTPNTSLLFDEGYSTCDSASPKWHTLRHHYSDYSSLSSDSIVSSLGESLCLSDTHMAVKLNNIPELNLNSTAEDGSQISTQEPTCTTNNTGHSMQADTATQKYITVSVSNQDKSDSSINAKKNTKLVSYRGVMKCETLNQSCIRTLETNTQPAKAPNSSSPQTATTTSKTPTKSTTSTTTLITKTPVNYAPSILSVTDNSLPTKTPTISTSPTTTLFIKTPVNSTPPTTTTNNTPSTKTPTCRMPPSITPTITPTITPAITSTNTPTITPAIRKPTTTDPALKCEDNPKMAATSGPQAGRSCPPLTPDNTQPSTAKGNQPTTQYKPFKQTAV